MTNKKRIKLATFAKSQGIAYITAYRHWTNGKIEGVKLPSGTILVSGWKTDETEEEINTSTTKDVIIYNRVSQALTQTEIKDELQKLTKFVEERDYNLLETIEEVAYAFSDNRPKLISMLYRDDWDILVIQNRNQFMKFGYPYIEALLRKSGREIIVADDYEKPKQTLPEEEGLLDLSSLTGEQELAQIFNRTKGFLKTLLGMGSQKATLLQLMQNFLK